MAKKIKSSITHLKKISRKSVLMKSNSPIVKGESIRTKGGYISVRVVVKTEGKIGSSTPPKLVLAKPNDPRSISIFIAGGSEVDRKVELANAKLISDID